MCLCVKYVRMHTRMCACRVCNYACMCVCVCVCVCMRACMRAIYIVNHGHVLMLCYVCIYSIHELMQTCIGIQLRTCKGILLLMVHKCCTWMGAMTCISVRPRSLTVYHHKSIFKRREGICSYIYLNVYQTYHYCGIS